MFDEKLLQKICVQPSFTPKDPTRPQDLLACSRVLDIIQSQPMMKKAVRLERLPFEGGIAPYRVDNLFAEWVSGTPGLTIMLSGHIDVVGADYEEPFSAKIRKGFLYARGATDMKAGVVAQLAAIKALLNSKLTNYRVILVTTSDEEWSGTNGTYRVLQWMKEQGYEVNDVLVGEPASLKRVADLIAIARRGSFSFNLTANGIPGHMGYADRFINPITHIIKPMEVFQRLKLKQGTYLNFSAIQSGNLKDGANVPTTAMANGNIRFTDDYTAEELASLLNKAMDDARVDRSIVRLTTFEMFAAKPYSSPRGRLFGAIRKSAGDLYGITPKLDEGGGSSDGRHVNVFYPNAGVVECGTTSDGGVPDDEDSNFGIHYGMHKPYERVKLGECTQLAKLYTETLFNYFS